MYAPQDFDLELIQRSQEEPEAWLKLQFVYGYSGLDNTAPNIFFTAEGTVAYYTAGVGIVFDKKEHKQTFFLKHDNDIVSMNIVDAEVEVAQYMEDEQKEEEEAALSEEKGGGKSNHGGPTDEAPPPGAELEMVKYPGRTLVATGQMKQGESDESGPRYPFVCIWDTRTGEEVRTGLVTDGRLVTGDWY